MTLINDEESLASEASIDINKLRVFLFYIWQK